MATIRWCPIFPKWDSYQPLFPTFVENKEQPRALQMYRTWTIGADTVLQIPCTNFVHCDVFCTCWYAHATLNKTYKTTSMVSNERFRIWSQDRLGNTFWWEVLPAVVRAWFPRAFSVWNQRVTICQNEPRKSRRKLSEVSHFRVTVPSRVCLQGKVQWMPFRLKIGDTSRIPQDTSGYLRIPPRNGNFKVQNFKDALDVFGVPPCHPYHAWLRRLSSRKGDVGDCAASGRQVLDLITLWLCQHSYWKWPLKCGFSY